MGLQSWQYEAVFAGLIFGMWVAIIWALSREYDDDRQQWLVSPADGLQELSAHQIARMRRWVKTRFERKRMTTAERWDKKISMCGSWAMHRNLVNRGYSLGEALDILGIPRRYNDEINNTRPVE